MLRGFHITRDGKGAVATALLNLRRGLTLAAVAVLAAGAGLYFVRPAPAEKPVSDVSSRTRQPGIFRPSASEWAALDIAKVEPREFRAEHITEGKITIDEDRSTPIYSPYSGRAMKLIAKPGDQVKRGQPLMIVETVDAVSGLNDFMAAVGARNKARSALELAETVEKRNVDLYAGKATPLKDLQQAQADLVTAQNDMRSATTTLDAARNRLRLLGRSDEEISRFEQTGKISSETPIVAPIDGTVVQRKVGPGQFLSNSAPDPVFVLGDLSTVWLVAYVRETDALKVGVGQDIEFAVLGFPGRVFKAKLDYVAAALDPATHRLLVRATVVNADGALRPEMFANVTIFTSKDRRGVAVPRSALIYDGSNVSVWAVREDKSIEKRTIATGEIDGDFIQVIEGLAPGDTIVTKGTLFIDRAASGT
jgi:cobalt-zinc-cadmium efflux system membrane fusion protein